jgi:hypothetical protein
MAVAILGVAVVAVTTANLRLVHLLEVVIRRLG